MEDAVNALIKEKALQVLTDYQVDPAADTLSVKCTVVSLDKNKAVLTYEGSLMVNGAAHPSDLFYTTTVDLNKGTLQGLSDYADAYTMGHRHSHVDNALVLVGKGLGEALQVFRREIALLQDLPHGVEVLGL